MPEWPGGVDVLNSLKDVATFHRPVSASMVSLPTFWMTRPLNSLTLSLRLTTNIRDVLHRYLGHAKQLLATLENISMLFTL